jgi:hypothetical protein
MFEIDLALTIPLMWFLFDDAWPTPGAAVFMTPTKVWGPLSVIAILSIFVNVFAWVLLAAILVVAVVWYVRWSDPHRWEKEKCELCASVDKLRKEKNING